MINSARSQVPDSESSSIRQYGDQFFDWILPAAVRSARVIVPMIIKQARARSVLDVGCGEGAWLKVWQECGVSDVTGIDGNYVKVDRLQIPPDRFLPLDLSSDWNLNRRFDLVESLEVAEHLPASSAEQFIAALCRHADIVVFSAAQPGQGGEFHVNEQPPGYWASLFGKQGYSTYDSIRPAIANNKIVEKWYRFNVLVYANEAGAARLDAFARHCKVESRRLNSYNTVGWELRRAILRLLPPSAVTKLSRLRYVVLNRIRSKSTTR